MFVVTLSPSPDPTLRDRVVFAHAGPVGHGLEAALGAMGLPADTLLAPARNGGRFYRLRSWTGTWVTVSYRSET